jgi:hypothetical protein
VFTLAWTFSADAEPPTPVSERAELEAAGVGDATDAYRHDGFFARADAGLAFLSASIAPPTALTRRTRIQAWGQSSQLSFGGTPATGLVVGGLLGAARLDPAFLENGVRVVPDDDSIKISLVRLGPFLDWYPRPRRGFHVQASLALAVQVESDFKGNPLEPAAIGPSTSFGLGHEWFLARSWSLGLIGRYGVGRLARTVEGRDERTLWETIELGLTSTYH